MAQFDPSIPSIARVYDYILGGKDNYAADRAQAEQTIAYNPLVPVMARENRQFLARGVGWVAAQGVDQFVDLGCGMPTSPNTHESARAVVPGARVAYVDNDPVAAAHLSALVAKGNPGIGVLSGDIRDPDSILAGVAEMVDLARPVGLVMGAVLHFSSPDEAQALVARYAAALAAGSYLVVSAARVDTVSDAEGFGDYSKKVASVYNHSPADFTRIFGSLELVPPGVADARCWHPHLGESAVPARPAGWIMAAVAKVDR